MFAAVVLVGTAAAREGYWQGDVSSDWNTAGNWFVVGGPGAGFVPQAGGGFNTRAIIGTDNPNGALDTTLGNSPVISAALPTAKATIAGLYLGLRERDFTVNPPTFPNPAPDPGTLVGALTINAGELHNVTTTEATFGADGRIVVGADGRGYLTMNGGTLTGLALVVGGENNTSGNGTSLLDLRGDSTLTVSGTSTFSRRLRVEGPDVDFSTSTQMRLESTSTFTAAITSATAHSPLRVTELNEKAILGGTLNVEFSGAAATRDPIASLGTKWALIDVNNLNEDAIDGSFSNVAADGSIAVSGLDAAHSAPLGATYALRKSTSGSSTLLELSYEAVLVLTVDRDSGQMTIRNPHGGPIAIDAYSISSARGSMQTTFSGLGTTTPGAGDWVKPAGNNANVISEVKVPDQTPPITNEDAYDLTSVPTVGIGDGFDKFAVASNVANFGFDGEDLIFEYGGPDTGDVLVRGQIEYVGTKFENNLVLRVNPNNGLATLKNDSLETLVFDGFEITSTDAALNIAGFTPVSGGTGTWQTDAEGTTGLSQVNFTGARTLAPGQEVSVGDISSLSNPFTSDLAQDGLSMQFILAEGVAPAGGDYNNDGSVDAADYTVWRDQLGQNIALSNENPAATTPGVVDQEDYDYWKAQFGMTGAPAPETEFRVGSIFFDSTLGSGSGGLAGFAVPEPTTGLLLMAGFGSLFFTRGRKHQYDSADVDSSERLFSGTGQVGVSTMSRRVVFLALIAVGIVAVWNTGRPTSAATGGLPITNFDMELPGPTGTKVVAFDETGAPIPGIIPGWTFTGPGVSLFGDEVPGDSGTEGGGRPGNAILLSTHDGKVYQTVPGHTIINPLANQQYRISYDAWDIFTTFLPDTDTELPNGFRLTSRLYYGAWPGTTLMTQEIFAEADSDSYEFLIPHNSPLLTAGVIGQSLGIEFDTTAVEYSIDEDPLDEIRDVAESWAHVDNVVFEIVGIIPGDLNGDGVVSLADSSNLIPNMQRNTPFEAEGELTNDNVVNLNDFRALKSLIAAAGSGSGSLAGENLAVPEPSSIVLFITTLGMSAGALARSRRRVRCLRGLAIAVVAAGSIAVLASKSNAELLAYDPIRIGSNPAAGEYVLTTFTMDDPPVEIDPLAGQNPTIGPASPSFFSGPWMLGSAGQIVQEESLSYLGTASIGGSIGDFGRTARFFAEPWDDTTEGTFYIGLQGNWGTTPDENTNMGYRAIEFYPPGVTPGENRIGDIGYNQFGPNTGGDQSQAATAKMHFRWTQASTQIHNIQASPAFNDDGLTHLLVLKFELTTEDNGDTISLFYDPKTPNEPGGPNVQKTGNFTLGGFGAASFANGNGLPTVLDEIRIGTTFADVVPPDLPIPGDCCGDMLVDIQDYNVIIANMNVPGPKTLAEGDVTGDGRVTIADYRFWKERRTDLSAGAGGISTAAVGVPEPSTCLLVVTGMALAIVSTSYRRRVTL